RQALRAQGHGDALTGQLDLAGEGAREFLHGEAPSSERGEQSSPRGAPRGLLPVASRPCYRPGGRWYQDDGACLRPLPGLRTPPSPSASGWRAILSAKISRSCKARSTFGSMRVTRHTAWFRLLYKDGSARKRCSVPSPWPTTRISSRTSPSTWLTLAVLSSRFRAMLSPRRASGRVACCRLVTTSSALPSDSLSLRTPLFDSLSTSSSRPATLSSRPVPFCRLSRMPARFRRFSSPRTRLSRLRLSLRLSRAWTSRFSLPLSSLSSPSPALPHFCAVPWTASVAFLNPGTDSLADLASAPRSRIVCSRTGDVCSSRASDLRMSLRVSWAGGISSEVWRSTVWTSVWGVPSKLVPGSTGVRSASLPPGSGGCGTKSKAASPPNRLRVRT